MNPLKVNDLLDSVGIALRTNRERVADIFRKNPNLIPELVENVFKIDDKLHHKAAWILELLLEKDLEILLPHIDYFTANIGKLTNESAIRPIAKICNWIAIAYVKKEKDIFIQLISVKNIEQIVESGFDWMIGSTKVATKAYTMNSLYLFGRLKQAEFQWVHNELKNIILQNINQESAAYKSRGKITLKLLDKEV